MWYFYVLKLIIINRYSFTWPLSAGAQHEGSGCSVDLLKV